MLSILSCEISFQEPWMEKVGKASFNSLLRDQSRSARATTRRPRLSILSCEIRNSSVRHPKLEEEKPFNSLLRDQWPSGVQTEKFISHLSILSCEIRNGVVEINNYIIAKPFNSLLRDQGIVCAYFIKKDVGLLSILSCEIRYVPPQPPTPPAACSFQFSLARSGGEKV